MRHVTGNTAQQRAAEWLIRVLASNGPLKDIEGIAPIGHKTDDVVINTHLGGKINVEVKSMSKGDQRLTILDRSVTRDTAPTLLDDVFQVYATTSTSGTSGLRSLLRREGYSPNFTGVVDFFRTNTDPTIGFSGDAGTPASGRMPPELATTDGRAVSMFRKMFLDQLRSKQISVLCIVKKDADDIEAYFTGFQSNLLKLPPIPKFKSVRLATYGNNKSKSTRVALKATI